jgi:hypothetical protein
MYAAAMRRRCFLFAVKSSRNDPQIVFALPHRIMFSPQRDFLRASECRRHARRWELGVSTKDEVWSSFLRVAGRLSRWLSVRRRSPRPFHPLPPGLIHLSRITARMRATPFIM